MNNKKIEVKTLFNGWKKVSYEQAENCVEHWLKSITTMKIEEKINYINENKIKGITVQEILENQKKDNKVFNENLVLWKDGIKFAEERIIEFYDKEKTSNDEKYITLETVGKQYSKKLANIMFDCGYGEWVFNNSGTLEKMKEQMIDILEEDKDLNKLLEEKNITREQLYRKIKEDFLESELSKYLQDNYIDIGMIPEENKEDMINQVRKGMLDNYSYKYIVWDSGDLEPIIETLPENCFISEKTTEEELC